MLDFASKVHDELLGWIAAGVEDEAVQMASLDDLERLSEIDDPQEHIAALDALEAERLAACAHAYAGQLHIERVMRAQLLRLLGDESFRAVLDELLDDDRLDGASVAEVLQWARIRHEGDDGAFERLMGMRVTGRK